MNKEGSIDTFKNPILSLDQAFELFKNSNTVFIDVRDPESYKQEHIPGAFNLNEIFTYLGTSDIEGIKSMKSEFENLVRSIGIKGDENIIIYEDTLKTRFGVSFRGYFILSTIGLKNVYILNGGWSAWKARDLPVDNKEVKAETGTFVVNWNDSLYAGKDDILKALKDKDTTLLDVRDDVEWKGESSSPYGVDFVPRKGRLENAVQLMWQDLITTDKDGFTTLKSPEDISEICEKKGLDKQKPIIVYCFKGARASNTLVALKLAGFQNVKNYFASWNEWAKDSNLPIDASKI